MKWEHKPERIPNLDRKDLETIALLVREYGNKHIPLFSNRLMKKIEESLSVYKWEDELHQQAKEKKKSIVTWPIGTEQYSNGPFFSPKNNS